MAEKITTSAAIALLACSTQLSAAAGQPGAATPLEPAVTLGPTYEISEPDLLKQIQEKLEADQASGKLQRDVSEAIARSKASMEAPPANETLRPTFKPRTFFYDPTIVASKDVRDPKTGAYIVKAGQTVNPLAMVSWPQPWIFLDARDAKQVAFAKQWIANTGFEPKILLTGGAPREAARALSRPVYFDQGSYFVRRFGINQVPALLTQEGLVLKIQEVLP